MISLETTQATAVVPYDILCGRDRDAFHNSGNRRFLETVSRWVPHYMSAPRKPAKSVIVNALLEKIREDGGRFMKKQNASNGTFLVELDNKQAREKVAHSLRDMAAKKSNKKVEGYKVARRIANTPKVIQPEPQHYYPPTALARLESIERIESSFSPLTQKDFSSAFSGSFGMGHNTSTSTTNPVVRETTSMGLLALPRIESIQISGDLSQLLFQKSSGPIRQVEEEEEDTRKNMLCSSQEDSFRSPSSSLLDDENEEEQEWFDAQVASMKKQNHHHHQHNNLLLRKSSMLLPLDQEDLLQSPIAPIYY